MNLLPLLLLAGPGLAGAIPVAGVIVDIVGSPELRPKSGPAKPLKLNAFVYEGDSVATRDGERVAVALIGGAELQFEASSAAEVRSGGGTGHAASIHLDSGRACGRMLHGLTGMKFLTPQGIASLRGTDAEVRASADMLDVRVFEGHVDLLSADGVKTLVKLQANQGATVRGGVASAPRTLSASEARSCVRTPPPTTPPNRQGPNRSFTLAKPPAQAVLPTVTVVDGFVGIRLKDAEPWVVVEKGRSLEPGAQLRTSPGQFLRLELPRGGQAAIHEDAELHVESAAPPPAAPVLYLPLGQAWLNAPKGGAIDCVTPLGHVKVSGEAELDVHSALTVKVYGGETVVGNEHGTVRVAAGRRTSVASRDGAPEPSAPLADGERGRWQIR